MAIDITHAKEIVNSVIRSAAELSALSRGTDDCENAAGRNGMTGSHMCAEEESTTNISRLYSGDVFDILVVGTFTSGKSTLINGLMGRLIRGAKVAGDTAFITMVKYGEHEDQVQVYRKGSLVPQSCSLKQFYKENEPSGDIWKHFEEGGIYNRFADVDYVVTECNNSLLRSGLRFIDTPGIQDENSSAKTAFHFIPKAAAIIFVLNALQPFTAIERRYIEENFCNRNIQNIFFAVNRIDNISSEDLDSLLKPFVRSALESVFRNAVGEFNQELYDKRVFYINAYEALCARTNQPCYKKSGGKYTEAAADMNSTGISQLEAALSEYLSSKEHIQAVLRPALESMAHVYQDACDKAGKEEKKKSLPLTQLEEKAKRSEKKLEDLRSQAEEILRLIDDEESNLAAILEQKQRINKGAGECKKGDQMITAMRMHFNEIYNTLYGHTPSEAEIAILLGGK